MPEAQFCSSCGSPLTPGVSKGLCARCLLKRGMELNSAGYSQSGEPQAKWDPPSAADLSAQFTDVEVTELIGRGGMGAVYKARQKHLDRIVALKILPPDIGKDPAFAERFAREAKALARLNHPNIVTLYEFGRTNAGLYYFLMEYVDGVNLRQLMNAGRVEPREALAIVPQVCDALQYAHDQGVVHRDIKPENILLDRRGRVKVADFGLAKITGHEEQSAEGSAPNVSAPLTEMGKVVGTPQYMAPEQAMSPGVVDHRADIYALGVVFYQMLTGELPTRPVEAPSHVVQIDVRLDEVVLRAIERDPERRYAQASVMKTEVETISRSPGLQAAGRPPAAPIRRCRQPGRLFRVAILCFAGAIILPTVAALHALHSPARYVAISRLKVDAFPDGAPAPTTERIMSLIHHAVHVRRDESVTVDGRGIVTLTVIGPSPHGIAEHADALAAELEQKLNYDPGLAVNVLEQATPPMLMVTPWRAGFLGFAITFGVLLLVLSVVFFVLARRRRRALMENPVTADAGPRLSHTALWGTIWGLSFFISPIFIYLIRGGQLLPPLAGLLIIPGILVMLAPMGATILGWISVAQIRRSPDRLHGLGLAVFAGMLYPILVLDIALTLIFASGLGYIASTQHYDPSVNADLMFLVCVAWVILDIYLIRRVWRAANRPSSGARAVLDGRLVQPALVPEAAPEHPPTGPQHPPGEARVARTAIAGALWAAEAGLAALWLILLTGESVPQLRGMSSPEKLGFFITEAAGILGVLATLGTTLLGCVAIAQIRRSEGRLRGLGLAVFDALLFPLLALDGAICWVFQKLATIIVDFYYNPGAMNGSAHPAFSTRLANALFQQHLLPIAVGIAISIIWDVLIVRWAWRAATRPGDGAAPRRPLEPPPTFSIPPSLGKRNSTAGYAAFFFASLSGVVPTLFLWLAPWMLPSLPPQAQEIAVWVTLATALIAIALGTATRRSSIGKLSLIMGGVNLTIWLMFFVIGLLYTPLSRPPLPVPAAIAPAVSANAQHLAAVQEQLIQAKSQLDRLRSTYGPNHPAVIQIQQEIRALQEQIDALRQSPEHGTFEPVVELTLHELEGADLDTGKLARLPESITKNNDVLLNPDGVVKSIFGAVDWMEQQGMDVFSESPTHLFGIGLRVLPQDKSAWDHMTAADVVAALLDASTTRASSYAPLDAMAGGATYAFQTREGGKGILQVVSSADDGVKIRYKLLEAR